MKNDHDLDDGPKIDCELCSVGHLHPAYKEEVFDHEVDNEIIVIKADRVPFEVCDSCGSTFVTKDTMRTRHEALCKQLGLITPSEIEQIRQHHRLSRTEFARITGFGEASLTRWERGRCLPNRGNSNYLKLLQIPGNMEVAIDSEAKSVGRLFTKKHDDFPEPNRFRHLPADKRNRLRADAERFSLIGCQA